MWSYVFHRLSGLALVVYLMMHIWVIHHVQNGAESFDGMMKFMHNPLFRLGEAALLAAVLYHAINGIRLVAINSGWGLRNYRFTFWLVFGICGVLGVVGGVVLVFG
jgi:succinate dehydrogenase / fumarate reductase cytochrome b subunit